MTATANAAEFEALIGAENVITGERLSERHPGYCADSFACGVLLTPRSTQEVSRICSLASRNGIGIVAHGGLTGLVDGTETAPGQVAVSFEKMNRIVKVDPLQGIAITEAGATLQALADAAAEHTIMPGVDVPSRGSCTIGGMVATNAGGVRAIRYGMMRDNVLGLEAVLADGTVLDVRNSLIKNNAGYDLKHLFIGSEGTLGLVTQVVVKLHDIPRRLHTALVGCAGMDGLFDLLRKARARFGGDLLSFEAMWPDYFRLTCRQPGFGPDLMRGDLAVYAVIETGQWGEASEESPLTDFLAEAYEAGSIADAVIAQSDAQRAAIWRAREDSDAADAEHGGCLSFDVGLEIKDIPDYVTALQKRFSAEFPDVTLYVFGHLGDGNLHVMAGQPSSGKFVGRNAIEEIVYGSLAAFDGTTVSAEHGIGLEKRPHLHLSNSPDAIGCMKTLKSALDPNGALNRNKIFQL